jgi:hypothetical protein
MKPVRAACGVFVAVCMSTLVLGNLPKGYTEELATRTAFFPNPLIRQASENGPLDSLGAIVKDATDEGGQVVMCKNHTCLDLATHEDMGQAQDGYYILFDRKDPQYEAKLQKYQERIRNWMERN